MTIFKKCSDLYENCSKDLKKQLSYPARWSINYPVFLLRSNLGTYIKSLDYIHLLYSRQYAARTLLRKHHVG